MAPAVARHSGEPDTRGNSLLLAVLLILAALSYLDRQIITLLVDPIKADLGVSDTRIGFAQGIGFVLFYAIAGIPLGMMVDRFSRRAIIFCGIVVWCLATAACGLARSYEELLAARFMVGAGDAALMPAAYSLIGDSFARERLATAMATFSLGAIVGGAVSMAIGGGLVGFASELAGYLPLVGPVAPWQAVFLLVGLGGLPFSLLVMLIREPARSAAAGRARKGQFADLRATVRANWRFYILHFAAFSVMAMPAAATAAWAATHLQRHFALPVAMVGLVLAAKNLATGTIGMLGSSMVADRLFRGGRSDAHLRLYLIAFPLAAACGALAFTTGSLVLCVAAMALLGLVTPFIGVAAAALQIATPSRHRGTISAAFLLVFNLVGFGAGPLVTAQISDRLFAPEGNIGAALALTFAVTGPLVALLFALALGPMRRAVAANSENRADNSNPRETMP